MPQCELIMAHGGVEPDVLASTEMKCNAPLSADAYFLAANFDHSGFTAANAGDLGVEQGALEYLQASLSYAPEHPDSLDMIIDVLENLHRYPEEVQFAQRAAQVLGPQWLAKLGRAYYLAGNTGEAVRIWRIYQQVTPYANVPAMQQSAEQKRQENDYRNRRQWPDPQQSADDPE
jgi:tetratricopeptide (TPR) repeat protein